MINKDWSSEFQFSLKFRRRSKKSGAVASSTWICFHFDCLFFLLFRVRLLFCSLLAERPTGSLYLYLFSKSSREKKREWTKATPRLTWPGNCELTRAVCLGHRRPCASRWNSCSAAQSCWNSWVSALLHCVWILAICLPSACACTPARWTAVTYCFCKLFVNDFCFAQRNWLRVSHTRI